jgi:hypothetical protein
MSTRLSVYLHASEAKYNRYLIRLLKENIDYINGNGIIVNPYIVQPNDSNLKGELRSMGITTLPAATIPDENTPALGVAAIKGLINTAIENRKRKRDVSRTSDTKNYQQEILGENEDSDSENEMDNIHARVAEEQRRRQMHVNKNTPVSQDTTRTNEQYKKQRDAQRTHQRHDAQENGSGSVMDSFERTGNSKDDIILRAFLENLEES